MQLRCGESKGELTRICGDPSLDKPITCKNISPMTKALSVKGQQPVRDRKKLKAGTDFTVITRSKGDIVLRPVRARRRHPTLASNLLALSGIDLDAERAPAREVKP